DAERVALGIGEDDPRHVALPDVEVPGTELEEPVDELELAVPAEQVEVQSQRLGRWLGDRLDAQVDDRAVGDREPGLEPLRPVTEPLAPEDGLPEPADPARVDGVEHDVLQTHGTTVGPAGGAVHPRPPTSPPTSHLTRSPTSPLTGPPRRAGGLEENGCGERSGWHSVER